MNKEIIMSGTVLLLVAGVFVFISRGLHLMDSHNLSAFFLMLVSAVFCLFVASTNYLLPWDERYHALVAKNLIEHPLLPALYENPILPYDYKQWAGNHIWVHKQPVTLWGMALSIKLFGTNVIAV